MSERIKGSTGGRALTSFLQFPIFKAHALQKPVLQHAGATQIAAVSVRTRQKGQTLGWFTRDAGRLDLDTDRTPRRM